MNAQKSTKVGKKEKQKQIKPLQSTSRHESISDSQHEWGTCLPQRNPDAQGRRVTLLQLSQQPTSPPSLSRGQLLQLQPTARAQLRCTPCDDTREPLHKSNCRTQAADSQRRNGGRQDYDDKRHARARNCATLRQRSFLELQAIVFRGTAGFRLGAQFPGFSRPLASRANSANKNKIIIKKETAAQAACELTLRGRSRCFARDQFQLRVEATRKRCPARLKAQLQHNRSFSFH